jgi:hypothetical protein
MLWTVEQWRWLLRWWWWCASGACLYSNTAFMQR